MKPEIKTVLEIGRELLPEKQRGGHRTSIYKPEILSDDLSKTERNSVRKQFRKKLESFIEAGQTYKSDEGKLKELKRAWKQYSMAVYNNPLVVLEPNAADDKQKAAKEFLSLMGGEKKAIIIPSKK